MNTQSIQKLSEATFRCEWEKVPDSRLKLNFDVIIQHFELKGDFCLLHWQAKPKGLRRWGVYDSIEDKYHSCDWDKIRFSMPMQFRTLQVDETKVSTVPTAVIYVADSRVVVSDDGMVNIVGIESWAK